MSKNLKYFYIVLNSLHASFKNKGPEKCTQIMCELPLHLIKTRIDKEIASSKSELKSAKIRTL